MEALRNLSTTTMEALRNLSLPLSRCNCLTFNLAQLCDLLMGLCGVNLLLVFGELFWNSVLDNVLNIMVILVVLRISHLLGARMKNRRLVMGILIVDRVVDLFPLLLPAEAPSIVVLVRLLRVVSVFVALYLVHFAWQVKVQIAADPELMDAEQLYYLMPNESNDPDSDPAPQWGGNPPQQESYTSYIT